MFGLAITMIIRSARPKEWSGLDVTLRTGRAIWGQRRLPDFFLFIWDALGLDGWGVFFLFAIGDFLCTLGIFHYWSFWVYLNSGISLFSLSTAVLVSWGLSSSLVPPFINLEILSINQNLSFMWPLPLIAKISERIVLGLVTVKISERSGSRRQAREIMGNLLTH